MAVEGYPRLSSAGLRGARQEGRRQMGLTDEPKLTPQRVKEALDRGNYRFLIDQGIEKLARMVVDIHQQYEEMRAALLRIQDKPKRRTPTKRFK